MKHGLSKLAAVAFGITAVFFSTTGLAAVPDRATATPDNHHITNGPIAEYVADTSASIAWSTRGSAEMAIRIGTDPEHLGDPVPAVPKSRGRNHHARIDGLKPDTTYFFQVVTGDSGVGEVGTFRTLKPGAVPQTRRVIVP